MTKNEFYIEPPFDYRPSVAQFMTQGRVCLSGVVADIMHLDRKKNLRILHYHPDGEGMDIKLLNENDLNDNEFYLYKMLEVRGKNKLVRFRFWDFLPKLDSDNNFLFEYNRLTQENVNHKLGIDRKHWLETIVESVAGENNGEYRFLDAACFLVAIIVTAILLNYFSAMATDSDTIGIGAMAFMGLAFSVLIALRNAIIAIKEGTLPEYTGMIFASMAQRLGGMAIGAAGLFGLVGAYLFFQPMAGNQGALAGLTLLLLIPAGGYFLWNLIVFAFAPIGALLNSGKAIRHIVAWKKFSNKINSFSQLKKKPLKYYELWGEFYYYALAVGAIEFDDPLTPSARM